MSKSVQYRTVSQKEFMVMELDNDDNKRQNIGMLSISNLEKEKIFQQYLTDSKAFAAQKIKSQESKRAVKALLQKKSKELQEYGEALDFVIVGDKLQLFKKAGAAKRQSRSHEIDLGWF